MVDDREKGGAFALGQSVGHLLHRAQQIASDLFAEHAPNGELTPRQIALLAAIGEQGGQSQTTLVRATGIDRSTLADMIGRLEQRELIKRQSAEGDRRAKAVWLTAKGKRAIQEAEPAALKADEQLIALIPKNRRQAFVEILQALAAHAAQAEAEADAEAAPRQARARPAAKPKAATRTAKGAPQAAKPAAKPTAKPAKTEPKPKAKAKPVAKAKPAKTKSDKNKSDKGKTDKATAEKGKTEKVASAKTLKAAPAPRGKAAPAAETGDKKRRK